MQQIIVRVTADGATAQLRVVAPLTDRETGRRLHAELIRIATELAARHDLALPGTRRDKRK